MRDFEIEQDDSFTVITNNILRNKELSNSAKGLLYECKIKYKFIINL